MASQQEINSLLAEKQRLEAEIAQIHTAIGELLHRPGPVGPEPQIAAQPDTKQQIAPEIQGPGLLDYSKAALEHRLRGMPGMETKAETGSAKEAITNIGRNLLTFAADDVPAIAKGLLESKSPKEAANILRPFIEFPVRQLGTAADALLLSYLPNYLLYGEEKADQIAQQAQTQIQHAPEGPALGLTMAVGGLRGAPGKFAKVREMFPKKAEPPPPKFPPQLKPRPQAEWQPPKKIGPPEKPVEVPVEKPKITPPAKALGGMAAVEPPPAVKPPKVEPPKPTVEEVIPVPKVKDVLAESKKLTSEISKFGVKAYGKMKPGEIRKAASEFDRVAVDQGYLAPERWMELEAPSFGGGRARTMNIAAHRLKIESREAAGRALKLKADIDIHDPKVRAKYLQDLIANAEKKAIPEELPSRQLEKREIGLNKTEIDRIRKYTGLDKLEPAERRKWERPLNEAKASKIHESALEIADEVRRSKRPITDTEHAGMVLKAADLANEYDGIIKTMSKYLEEGNKKAAEFERVRAESVIDNLDKLTEGTKFGRREAARTLSIGRMMVNREGYGLAHVVQRATASKGKKLTSAEAAKFERLASDHAALETKLKEIEGNYDKIVVQNERLRADRVAQHELRRAKIIRRTKELKKSIQGRRKGIKKELAGLGYRLNDVTGVTSEGAYLVGKLAITYIEEGAITLRDVVGKVLKDLPELTERDVYQSLIAKDPKVQARAKNGVTQQVSQLKTQARLLLEIEKAERGIFTATKKHPVLQSVEIRSLQRKLRDLRTEAYRNKNIKPSNLERAITTINELQDMLASHRRAIRKKQPVATGELATAHEKIGTLRRIMRVEDQLSDLNNQLRTGEFKIAKKPRPKQQPVQLERAEIELKRKRREIRGAIDDMAPWTAKRMGVEAINTARTLKATADMSATLRQGIFLSARRPIFTAKALARSAKSFFDRYTAEQIDNAIRSADHHYIREKSKLDLAEIGGRLNKAEEMFQARVIERVPALGPIVKASERHMVTHLNLLRTAAFDQFFMKYPNATHAELTAWANYVNIASGRGSLGKFANAANALSLGIFAPRFSMSRIQTPLMLGKHWKHPRVRKEIAKDYAAFVAMGTTVLALAALAGHEVGLDPREADFGKIRVGDTRIDIWGGFQQPARVVARIGLAASDKAGLTGQDLTDREKDVDPVELIGRFSRYKLAPSVNIPVELLRGETVVGEQVTPIETGIKALIPMVYEDIYDAYRQEGAGRAALVGGLTFFGVGATTYEDSQSRTRRAIRKMKQDGNYLAAEQKRIEWNIKHPDKRIVNVKIK